MPLTTKRLSEKGGLPQHLQYVQRIALLVLVSFFLFPSVSDSMGANQFAAYVEQFAMGSIDWDEGIIYGVGRSYLDQNNGSRLRAQGAAGLLASGNIVKLAAGLRLDDKRTLQSLGKGKVTINIKAFIRDVEVSKTLVEDKGRPYYEVVRVANMKGVEGLTANLLKANSKKPIRWVSPPKPTAKKELDDEEEAWLVLDARHLPSMDKVNPALFPKILDDRGKVIYGLRLVSENAVVQRGMARYVTSSKLQADLQTDQEPMESILARVTEMLAVQEAFAAGSRKRSKRREFVVKKVTSAEGLQRTNLVVSASDANTLKTEDVSSKILQNCRVIIVMSSPVGGIEGAIFKIITSWS